MGDETDYANTVDSDERLIRISPDADPGQAMICAFACCRDDGYLGALIDPIHLPDLSLQVFRVVLVDADCITPEENRASHGSPLGDPRAR